MGIYFLDTSALVKNYVSESGSDWVIAQYHLKRDHTLIISQATLVEAIASFCRKARDQNINQRISEAERDRIIALFRQDTQRRYCVARVTSAIYIFAGDLCRVHKLRAYDAIQLACALVVRKKLADIDVEAPTFVSADIELLNIAHEEGLSIINPVQEVRH